MANFEASQQTLKSIINSLRKSQKDYDYLQIIHVEATRPDIDFFNLFDEQFEPSERKRDQGKAYIIEINQVWDLIKTQYSKKRIESTAKKVAKTLLEILNSKKPRKYYLVDQFGLQGSNCSKNYSFYF